MYRKLRSVTAIFGLVLTASGCGAEQSDDSSAARETTEEPLSGGIWAYPSFARDTGTLLIQYGCTAARVGPRHILTAAHCVGGYLPGRYLSITQSINDQNADWSTVQISRVWVHPSFAPIDLLCGNSLRCTRDHGAADVAVIQTAYDLPNTITSARVGTQRYEAAGYARRVFINGYGCEGGIGGPTPLTRSLGLAVATIEPVSSINRYGRVLSDVQIGPFNATYMLTPGASHERGTASLCPGDSGGSVFLDRPAYPGGPGFPTNVTIGVNADYTFNGSGYSTFNIHTRLSNEAPNYVGSWLQRVLPESSFYRSLNP